MTRGKVEAAVGTNPLHLEYVTLPSRRHAATPSAHLRTTEGHPERPTLCGWTTQYAAPIKGEPVKVCTACESLSTSLTFLIQVSA